MHDFSAFSPGTITASLVVSSTGAAVSDLGNSAGLGNDTDLEFLKWLRSRAEVVLTSGLTAEIENYRMPTKAKLAILTNQNRNYPRLSNNLDDVIWCKADSYVGALDHLQKAGYKTIHTEFGPTGFVSLVDSGLVDGFISSKSKSGIMDFASEHSLSVESLIDFGDLSIAKVLGRGKA